MELESDEVKAKAARVAQGDGHRSFPYKVACGWPMVEEGRRPQVAVNRPIILTSPLSGKLQLHSWVRALLPSPTPIVFVSLFCL